MRALCFPSLLVGFALLGACDGCNPVATCTGAACVDGGGAPPSDGGEQADAGPGVLGAPCEEASTCDSRACFGGRCAECSGTATCGAGRACVDGACVDDSVCADAERCGSGGSCCPALTDCVDGVCRGACDTQRCGDDLAQCCAAGEICYGGGCRAPGVPCQLAADCPRGEVCEPDLGVCLPEEVVGACEYIPPPGAFSPFVKCRWTPAGLATTPNRDDVVMAPVVGNLTDDNGDGVTDRFDIPEVAFVSYDLEGDGCCNQPATLQIVRGSCNPDGSMATLASLTEPALDNSGGLALGDLDGDGVMEIVAMTIVGGQPRGTVAFQRTSDDGSTWAVLWHNPDFPAFNVHTRGGAQPLLTDWEGDGDVEVVVGNVALDGESGALLWDGVVTASGAGGIGNNAFLGPVSVVADLDLDGVKETIAGNTAYGVDGAPLWTFAFPSEGYGCGGSLPCDGFPAAANFDDDPEGEVVIVRQGELFFVNHDGTPLDQITIPVDDCPNNEAGPPTVADFDGDGRAEVGTAAGDFYVVADLDCRDPLPPDCLSPGVRWAVPNQDCSSRVTASSVFDFEADGSAEVIYADEDTFRILSGVDGTELYVDASHGSHTRLEMAVIADVDNDGNAEVVIAENGYAGGTPGVEIWGDELDNWVFTRRIWSQHSYHVTHITEEGRVLGGEPANWQVPGLNNFRQNSQGEGVFWAPDAVAQALQAVCGPTSQLTVRVEVANQGSRMMGPGVRAAVVASGAAAAERVLGVLATSRALFPGDSETLEGVYDVADLGVSLHVRVVADDDGNGLGAHNECVEDNNVASAEATCVGLGG